MAAVSCADAELIAAGVEFKILRDRFVTARRQSKPCDDIRRDGSPVFNRIMALPATTIEGLAVKADIVRHCYEKAFDDSFERGCAVGRLWHRPRSCRSGFRLRGSIV